MLSKKIDFAIIISVKNANPNGDPLNGNRPRVNYDGLGEISDVCIKRKIRNSLLDDGVAILVQSDAYRIDEHRSIKARYDANKEIKAAKNDDNKHYTIACKTWYDVRAFGQVLAFKGKKGEKSNSQEQERDQDQEQNDGSKKTAGVSIPIRGPVSIQSAFSIETVDVENLHITKSVNLETEKVPIKKAKDTMGMKHRVNKAVYVSYGSINKQLAEKTGFTDDDAEKLKTAILKMFENDMSSARPAGSMVVTKLIWWTHTAKTLSSAKVHGSLAVNPDGTYYFAERFDGIDIQEIDGE